MALINCIECNREISAKAKSCPGCGHPIEETESSSTSFTQTDPILKQNKKPNKNACPSCQSENTQSIKTMCLAGTSTNATTAFGVSSDLDIGVGRINTNSQTALAEKFTPGTNPDSAVGGCGCFLVIVGIILMSFATASNKNADVCGVFGGLGILFGIILFILMFASQWQRSKNNTQTEWDSKVKRYDEGWICLQCGNNWIPNKNIYNRT